MSYCKILALAFFLATNFLIIQKSQGQRPALVASPSHNVPVSTIGDAQSFTINSVILGESREVLIVLPASYSKSAKTRTYPVMVVADGEYLVPTVASVSDELSRNGQIPECVVVGIKNVGGGDFLSSNQKRVYDLTPPGLSVSGSGLNEGGDLFLDFIEKELLPALDKQFKTSAPRFFIGVSSGAVLATYAAATRPIYRAVVSLDAPMHLGDNWLAKKLIIRASSGGSPVRYASLEAKFSWPADEWTQLVNTAPKTWNLYHEKFQLEGHETLQMPGAYIGLRQVFSDYSRFSMPEISTQVLPYYDALKKLMGAELIPPKTVLVNLVQSLIEEGRIAMAREAYKKLVYGYGAPLDSAKIILRIKEIENNPIDKTVEEILATPFPTPEEARLFIGKWVGDIWMGADQPRLNNTFLRIYVVDGKVVGETVHVDGSGGEHLQSWGYLKITREGLTWGRLNDRQPKGVMLFEGKLVGEVLSGTAQFAGIKLENPPPPLNFLFKRIANK